MLVTSDKEIFKPKKDQETVNRLEEILTTFNLRMTPYKHSWATSVMHYNLVSKAAYRTRFELKETEDGRKDAEGYIGDFYTEESIRGPYKVSSMVKKKVDNYFTEYSSREFDCEVKSIGSEKYRPLVKYLQKTSFDEVNFRKANSRAFFDALLKGVGYIRPRLYDITSDNRESKLPNKIQKINNIKSSKRGFQIEYTDAEDVYFDPSIRDNKEMIISTPMSQLELLSKVPQMEKLIIRNDISRDDCYKQFSNKKQNDKNNTSYNRFYLANYKLGENLSLWYNNTDTSLVDLYKGKTDNKRPHATNNPKILTFDAFWDNIYGGSYFSQTGENEFNTGNKYRFNEYYNIAENIYIVWIGDYVLYNGPILEFSDALPVCPIYFDDSAKHGLIGRSVNDHLNALQIDTSQQSTDNKHSMAISSSSLLLLDQSRIDGGDGKLKIDKITPISINTTLQDGTPDNSPIVQQVPLNINGLDLNIKSEMDMIAEAEQLFPNTEPIFAQQQQMDREKTIRARMLRVDNFLKLNALNLSEYAYRVLYAKLVSLLYLQEDDTILSNNADRSINIIVRESLREIIEAKQMVAQMLQEDYELRVQKKAEQLTQDEGFMASIANAAQAKASQLSAERDVILSDENIPAEAKNQSAIANAEAKILQNLQNEMLIGSAKEQTEILQDENMYVNLSDLQNIFNMKKDFQFSFLKTKDEQKREIQEFLSVISSIPLAGQAIDYSHLLKEIVVSYGFSPDTVYKEVGTPDQLQSAANTRATIYYDAQRLPSFAQKYAEKGYGISLNTTQESIQSNPYYIDLTATANIDAEKEIKIASNRIQQQGTNKIIQKGFDTQMGQINRSQELAQGAIDAPSVNEGAVTEAQVVK